MTEKTELKLEETKLYTLYFHELWWLSTSIINKTQRLFEETSIPEKGFIIECNPDLHSLIASVLSDAAAIRRFLNTPSSKAKDESGRQFRLRKARSRQLNELVGDLGVTEILDSKVRNTLEHFDEYLDETNIALTESKDSKKGMAAYNTIISHWEVMTPRLYPIRLYVSSERKFYNMKWSVDLGKLHNEAVLIANRIGELKGFSSGELGSLLITL